MIVPLVVSHDATLYDAPVIMKSITCNGSEDSVIKCVLDGYGIFANCSNVAGAQCEG